MPMVQTYIYECTQTGTGAVPDLSWFSSVAVTYYRMRGGQRGSAGDSSSLQGEARC